MSVTLDPYSGPTSLDSEIDSLVDPLGEERPDPIGETAAAQGAVICRRRGRSPSPLAGAATPGLSRKAQGELDRKKLRAALAEADLKEKPRADFEDMLDRIHEQFGEYPSLTERQRAYVENVLEELGVDHRDPAERNAAVPRGREVQLTFDARLPPRGPANLGARNLKPELCALRNGATEDSCLHCGGDCFSPPRG
jgi:hypothetical protein